MNAIAQIGGTDLIHSLFIMLIVGICIVVIYAAGAWFIRSITAPPFAMTIWNGLFILIGVIVILNFLLSLAGRSIWIW